VPRNDRGGGCA